MHGLGARTIGEYVAAAGVDAATVAAQAAADPRYRGESLRPPRKIGRHLALFDCVNCDKCLPACPNDANFVYETEPLAREYESYRVEGGRAVPVAGGRLEARERHQIGTFQDFCNDCGNCDTFCPRTAGRTSRSRASSARSRPGGSRRAATASTSGRARARTPCGGAWGESRTVSR